MFYDTSSVLYYHWFSLLMHIWNSSACLFETPVSSRNEFNIRGMRSGRNRSNSSVVEVLVIGSTSRSTNMTIAHLKIIRALVLSRQMIRQRVDLSLYSSRRSSRRLSRRLRIQ